MKQSHVEQFNEALEALRKKNAEQPDPAFVQKLEVRLHQHLTSKKAHPMNSNFFKLLFARPLLPVAALAVLVLAVALVAALPRGTKTPGQVAQNPKTFHPLLIDEASAEENFVLKANNEDALGVDPTTTFTLTSKIDLTLADVKAAVLVTPELPFTIQEVSSKEFTITPKQALASGTVYSFALGTTIKTKAGEEYVKRFSWAYQAKETLQVTGMLPHDKATGVPVDTGIEVTFNTTRVESLNGHFTITPTTKGRFEKHGRVFSFIPEERLKAATVYTVTVSKGLAVKGSDIVLGGDVTARFETATEGSGFTYYSTFDQSFTAVRPNEAPVIQQPAYAQEGIGNKSVATVYKFQNVNQMLERLRTIDDLPSWAYSARQAAQISADSLSKVGEFPLTSENDALHFPSGFDVGFYLIDIPVQQQHVQTALIVSNISASLTLARNQSALWVYDLETKKPIVRATVTSKVDAMAYTTDDKGLVTFKTPSQLGKDDSEIARSYFIIKDGQGQESVVPVVPQNRYFYGGFGGNTAANGDYWSYLWDDRTLYHPTDTLNVWGVARNRVEPNKQLDVTLSVQTWQYVDNAGNYIPLLAQTVKTDDYSTFKASLRLEQLQPGYYTLVAKVGDTQIANRSFEVKTFTKPAYHILVTPSKLLAVDGDTETYDVQTEFFDGTPAPHIALRYGISGNAGDKGIDITTDDHGHASVSEKLQYEGDRQYPSSHEQTFYPTQSAEGNIASSVAVTIFPSLVSVDPSAVRKGNTVTLTATIWTVNLDASGNFWEGSAGFQKDPVPNTSVTGTIYENVTTKTKRGTQYDYIEKKVIDVYDYHFSKVKRQDFSRKTNSHGVFTQTFTLTGDSYTIDVAAKDTQGRTAVRTVYVGLPAEGYYPDAAGYSLRDERTLKTESTSSGQITYRIGDQTTLQVLKDSKPAPSEGTFLFLKLQNGVRATTITNTSSLPVTFTEADAPNVFYAAVWFDGTGFKDITGQWDLTKLEFDQSTRQLSVSVTAEKSSYQPGETAKLSVAVTDADGKPVKALVNLSAIDEALTSIQWENSPTPLASLYTDVQSGVLQQYVSHAPLELRSGAEGGGGGEQPRRDFKDAALFQNIETGGDGKATVTFKLPDNITSWRITAQGVTKTFYAGHSITMLPVTKPIFGSLTMQEDYVVSDHPTLVAHAYGTSLKANTDVTMSLNIPDLHFSQSGSVKAFAEKQYPINALAVGDHDVTLTVQSGGDKDILIRTMHVLSSRLTRTTSAYTDVKVGQTFSGSNAERTTIVFSDTSRGRIIASLQNLAWAYGKRLERFLGAQIAADTMKTLNTKTDLPSSNFDPLAFQQEDGGISQISYGSSDLSLSALAANRSDLFDAVRLRDYFTKKLEEKNASREQIGDSLLGLAEMHEPVLPDLKSFLELDGITAEDKLTAALAFQALGDNNDAETLAHELLKNYGEAQDPYIRLKLGDSNDEKIVNSARFDILAEGLKLPERFGFAKYLADTFPVNTITNLERSVALEQAALLIDDTSVNFHYSLNGEEKLVDLSKEQKSFAIALTSNDLKNFTVTSVEGSVGAAVLSSTSMNTGKEKVDTRLSLDRSYHLVGRNGKDFQAGDIVEVVLNPHVASGVIDKEFFVIDSLPSGLVPITDPWQRGLGIDQRYSYPLEINGQRLTFYSDGNRGFYYYARVFAPGNYAAEPALIQGQNSRDLINYSGGQSIVIH